MRHAIAICAAWMALGAGGCSDPAGSANGAAVDAAVDAGYRECEGGRGRTYYRDGDGDGFGVPGTPVMHGCEGDDVPAGFADNGRDCDDTDSSKQEALFADSDGDGFGDANASACLASGASGHSRQPGDCDDENAERSPAAAEDWFDGTDTDCDGRDNPAGCVAAPGVPRDRYATPQVELPPLDRILVDTAPDCAGRADLYLAIVNGCPVCGGGLATVVVANSGTAATAFRVTSNEDQIDVTAVLSPQAVAEPLSLRLSSPGSTIRVTPLGDVSDCQPDNDDATVQVGFTDCE